MRRGKERRLSAGETNPDETGQACSKLSIQRDFRLQSLVTWEAQWHIRLLAKGGLSQSCKIPCDGLKPVCLLILRFKLATLQTSEGNCTWRQGLWTGNWVKISLGPNQSDRCACEKRHWGHAETSGVTHTEKRVLRGHREKAASCRLRTEASGESTAANILILAFQPTELRGNTLLLLKPPSSWYLLRQPCDVTHSPIIS